MAKKKKMDKKPVADDVQSVIDTWNSRFADLQKRKEAGEKISNEDVRAIILDVGSDIYSKGVQPSIIDTSKKNTQLIQIMGKIKGQKFPLDSMIEHSGSKVKVNALQLAAIKAGEAGSKGEIIAQIVRDPDFLPLKVSGESVTENAPKTGATIAEDTPAVLSNSSAGQVQAEESIEEQSARASRNLLAKLAPPENMNNQASPLMTPTSAIPKPADPVTDALFKGGFQSKQPIHPQQPNGALGGLQESNSDPMPAQMVQMPVQVIEPMEDVKKLPKDALGRIVH